MIEQVSNAIQFLAHFVASGVGATGLTVTVDVRKWDGTTVTTIATDAAATEIGGGLYGYSLASGSTSDEAIYTAVFKTAGTADQKHLPALWCVGKASVEKLDATVTSRHASGAAVASVSGDVGGKVLGGGSGTISGTGARVALASDGLDSVSITAPSGVALNFREMMVQVWRRFFKKATQTDSQIKTYADDGSTVVTTQTVSDDGTTETQGAAS